MRTMYDSVTAANLPVGGQIYAYYVNGLFANGPAVCGRFPQAIHVSIAVTVSADGQVLDVETDDATPAQAPAWCERQTARGQIPTVYCNTATWPAVQAACRNANVAMPQWWEAHYDGVAQLSPGSVAKQYLGSPGNSPGPYDVSCVADHWPGVDPAPAKPIPLMEVQMFSRDPKDGSIVFTDATGTTLTYAESGSPGGHFLGNLINHPKYNAGQGKAEGPCVGVTHYDDKQRPWCGYILWTRDATGTLHPYNFPSDGSHAGQDQ